jgi:hypothetical protein
MCSKGFKNPWLLTKRLQKEPILMGHEEVQACWYARSVAILLWMFKGHAFCWCVWWDSTTIVNNVMDKLSPSLMDKLTFCKNYLYSCGQVIFIFVKKLFHLWCLFCLKRYVCWLCLYAEMEAMRDRDDFSMKTDSKETRIHKPPFPFFTKETWINKPPSHLFTVVALQLHGSEECY